MELYNALLIILGLAFFVAALYPLRLEKAPVSLPVIFLALGSVIPFMIPNLPELSPIKYSFYTEKLTEMAVIISLTTAGLKIDRIEGWKSWNSTWRLLGITMPLCIAIVALNGFVILGLPIAVAILLGAVLAPTDPVLASDVQVGPPGERKENEVRFSLTSEAGLNDALAFPFVNLALVLSATGFKYGLKDWLTIDVLWKLGAGFAIGLLIGWAAGKLVRQTRSVATGGFVALALTLFAYGATEMIHGYGFLGVFIAARVFRHTKKDSEYFSYLHDFSEQIEKLLMTILMIMLGISITQGLLSGIEWRLAGIVLLFLIVIRPVAGFIALAGSKMSRSNKIIISFYGIRGIGSMYYLAYAVNHSEIGKDYGELLWAIVGLAIVLSVVIHGLSVSKVMRRLEDQ